MTLHLIRHAPPPPPVIETASALLAVAEERATLLRQCVQVDLVTYDRFGPLFGHYIAVHPCSNWHRDYWNPHGEQQGNFQPPNGVRRQPSGSKAEETYSSADGRATAVVSNVPVERLTAPAASPPAAYLYLEWVRDEGGWTNSQVDRDEAVSLIEAVRHGN